MTRKELDFAVFCIENVAERLGVSGDVVYRKLAEMSDLLDGYIIAYYDSLHTQGKEYIVDDILEIMEKEGVLCYTYKRARSQMVSEIQT